MNLNLVKIAESELNGEARCILALGKKPFFFLWYKGNVLMNQAMQDGQKITGALETMWRYDFMENDDIMAEVDAATEIIKQEAGSTAAMQAWEAWRIDADRSRKARAKAKAAAWIAAGNDRADDATWDLLDAMGYDRDFLRHGLWEAYLELRDKNPNDPRYRNYHECWVDAAALYGFRMGQQAGAATGSAVKDDLIRRIPQLTEEKARLVSVVVNEFLSGQEGTV